MDISEAILTTKYAQRGETWRDVCNRVAGRLLPDTYHEFRDILLDKRFLPGGRILSSIGTTKSTTAYNCFVSGRIEDSFVSGDGSIMQRATEAAATMRVGGGIGYDFSRLRPRGSLIRQLGSQSTGPVSFMEIFNAICNCVSSSGHRRGAQMAILRVDHPDIEEFVNAKQNATRLTGFNLSVAVTDEFMKAVQEDGEFSLHWDGSRFGRVNARVLWEKIMRSTWDWGEPGVVFIDRINEQNNLAYCEKISATNPCGEQPLPPFGACLLGSFNLVQYLRVVKKVPLTREFDFELFEQDVAVVVEAMDAVVDIPTYPLKEQMEEARSKRRMGLGVTGTANALEALGLPYGSPDFIQHLEEILSSLKNEAYKASAFLAKRKGAFPMYRKDEYLKSSFVQGLRDSVKTLIAAHGIRNSHLTSIAPTGTISLLAENVSSGIEPVFAHAGTRRVQMPDGIKNFDVTDYGVSHFGVRGKLAESVTASEHVAVLTAAQRHVDSSVAKTCNVAPDMSWKDFKELYMQAWLNGAKGCTTFPTDGGKRGSIMTVKKTDEPTSCAAGGCS